ncbi:hypothetical protein C7402_1414 [Paraburkholderia unamae]|uniref:Uncharacterized protein n=1 Tax=Paraburkholderia unamae TaxID=219649 RepID=A0ABX5K6X4_9BURK|nr:hypothetical protein C7402_1414 [Paraburkholderia unamae]
MIMVIRNLSFLLSTGAMYLANGIGWFSVLTEDFICTSQSLNHILVFGTQ